MVMIELDRPRELRFGFKALKMVKAMTKKSLPDIMKDLEEQNKQFLDEEILQQIMYCGLICDDKDLKYDDLEDLLDKKNYREVESKLMEAITEAYSLKATDGDGEEKGKK